MARIYQPVHGEWAPADRLLVTSSAFCVALSMIGMRRIVEPAFLLFQSQNTISVELR
jgi:hypothetical protein